MTPAQFQQRWTHHAYNEQQGYQRHFADLCALADFDPPHDLAEFTFEKGADKLSGGKGRADVWLRGHFGWEYKGPGADLDAAYRQLNDYREALQNPPLLVVSDLNRVVIHTNFPNTVHKTHAFDTATIGEPATLALLRALFFDPASLNPGLTREAVTQDAARRVADVFDAMTARQVDPHEAAHFLMRIVFCLFAEDVRLLPDKLVTDLLRKRRDEPDRLDRQLAMLFAAMAEGGDFGSDEIRWFNGGLFDGQPTIPLTRAEITRLADAADLDWAQVEPSVFGSLLEGALSHDEHRRRRLGAHYTARADIELIVGPVLMAPLRREWAELQARCDQLMGQKNGPAQIRALLDEFKHRLGRVRVLDPACGSGNFLYVALANLLDLEHEVHEAGSRWGEQPGLVREVGPQQLFGLDLDPYAAELASVTVWIGYLQWRHEHIGVGAEQPLLATLKDNIRSADAVLNADGTEPEWPEADVIVGNPPFLVYRKKRQALGAEYVSRLASAYDKRVADSADLCCFWFERTLAEMKAGRCQRAGLVATNSIRFGQSRQVLDRIAAYCRLHNAWSDRPWRIDGAAVRISIVCFGPSECTSPRLNGLAVPVINADLTAGVDVTAAKTLRCNKGRAFIGTMKKGPFDVPGELARTWLDAPNANGRSNRDVLRPCLNGNDLTQRPRDIWTIDFGVDMAEEEAMLYEAPYEYLLSHTPEAVRKDPDGRNGKPWYLHASPAAQMRRAVQRLERYLVTPMVARQRFFLWVSSAVLPDQKLVVFATDEDYEMGILSSKVHILWALRRANPIGQGNDPTYSVRSCYPTFAYPEPTEAQREAIGAAARQLDVARRTRIEGDPTLTLTALYNKRPAWLQHAHAALDAAVMAAYGWPTDLTDEQVLERLLALNLARAAAG